MSNLHEFHHQDLNATLIDSTFTALLIPDSSLYVIIIITFVVLLLLLAVTLNE